MAAGLLLQYLLIALAALLSAGYVVQSQWPGVARRLRIACALPLLREGRPRWLRALGRRLAPLAPGDGGACGSGCNGCGPAPARK